MSKKKNKQEKPFPERWEVIQSDNCSKTEKRYVIINSDTKEIVDDANGYGYKSKQSAYKVGYYKVHREEIEEKKKVVRDFLKNHKEFANNIEWVMFDCIKDHEKFTAETLEEIAEEHNLQLPVPAKTFLHYITEI